jgi:hypothetical protein
MLLALEALPDVKAGLRRPYDALAERSLLAAHGVRRERASLRGHTGQLWSAAFSGDGKLIVTARGWHGAAVGRR